MKFDSESGLALPPALLADIRAAADDEHRPAAEIVQEALERYLAQRKGSGVAQRGRTPAEAAARLRAKRNGTVLPDGVTIRDLMTHGRA